MISGLSTCGSVATTETHLPAMSINLKSCWQARLYANNTCFLLRLRFRAVRSSSALVSLRSSSFTASSAWRSITINCACTQFLRSRRIWAASSRCPPRCPRETIRVGYVHEIVATNQLLMKARPRVPKPSKNDLKFSSPSKKTPPKSEVFFFHQENPGLQIHRARGKLRIVQK